jgi:putative copper export protein
VAALVNAITGWVLFAGLVIALGSITARWVFIPKVTAVIPEAEPSLRAAAARLGLTSGLFLPVAMGLVFARQLLEFRDPFVPWTEDALLLLAETPWGSTWTWATVFSLIVLGAFVLAGRRTRPGWWVATGGVIALATYPALSGHASGTEGLRPITLTADFLHVVAAGTWIGGLAFVLTADRRWRSTEPSRGASLLPILVPIFSPVAIASVITLIVTGGLAAWVHVEGLAAVVTTGYGRLLALKLSIVLIVMYIGAVNWRRLTRRLGEDLGQAALRRSATFELVAAQIVLIVTALLVRTSPMAP